MPMIWILLPGIRLLCAWAADQEKFATFDGQDKNVGFQGFDDL